MGLVCMDTVALLQRALEAARAGELTGVVCVTFRETSYQVLSAGVAEQCPTYALGAMVVAQRELESRAVTAPSNAEQKSLMR